MAAVPTARTVLVFRKRLLAYSETFISEQARHLPTWRAVLCGYTYDPSGAHLLEGHRRSVLSDMGHWPVAGKLQLRSLGRVPARWRWGLRAVAPRVVHAHFGPDAADASVIAHCLEIPLVATFHGFDITVAAPRRSYRERRRRVFERAQIVIAVSEFIHEKLLAAGCPEHKIVVHRIGIDSRAGGASRPLEERDLPVLFVGRLVEKKGARYLLEAMAEVQRDRPSAELHVVGAGPLGEALEQQARLLGLSARFHGALPNSAVRERMARARVLCVPSVVGANGDAEGLPTVLLEAQASGTPIVSTHAGGVPEGVAHGRTGLLTAERDGRGLAECLRTLLSDDERWREYSSAGPPWIRERFDIHRQCASLEQIYQEAVDKAS